MLHNLFLGVLVVVCLPGWVLSALDGRDGYNNEDKGRQVSKELYHSLEELSRLVDIAYCVGTTGIYKPFNCAGRCHEFEEVELIKVSATLNYPIY